MCLQIKIDTFWKSFIKNERVLRRYAAGERSEDCLRAYAILKECLVAIHPDVTFELGASSSERNQYALIFSLASKPYLYIVHKFIDISIPEQLLQHWTLINGEPSVAYRGEAPMAVKEANIQLYTEKQDPTVLHIYSSTIDLYKSENYLLVVKWLTFLLGEGFMILFVRQVAIDMEVSEDLMDIRQFVYSHTREESDSEGAFPQLPFDPLATSCGYDLPDVGYRGLRLTGSTSFPNLLDELSPIEHGKYIDIPTPQLNELSKAGIALCSVQVYGDGDYELLVTSTLKFLSLLSGKMASKMFFCGSAQGGVQEEVYIVDLLVSDVELLEKYLLDFTRDASYQIEFLNHSQPAKDRCKTIRSLDTLTIAELDRIGASPSLVLAKIQELTQEEKEEYDILMLTARTLNRLERYGEAIELLQSLVPNNVSADATLYYSLGIAYNFVTALEAPMDILLCREQAAMYYEQCYDVADIHKGACACHLARLYFEYPISSDRYEVGCRWRDIAKNYPEEWSLYQYLFIEGFEGYTNEQAMAIQQVYQECLGTPMRIYTCVLSNGYRFDVHLYEMSERTRKCHILVTQGLLPATYVVGTKSKINQMGLEFVIALNKDTDLDSLFPANEEAWYIDVLKSLANNLLSQELTIDELLSKRIYTDDNLSVAAYPDSQSFLLRSKITGIMTDNTMLSPIELSSHSQICFIGITPLYKEEADYARYHSESEARSKGLYRVSPIFNPKRVNLCSELVAEDVDIDAFLSLGRLPSLYS